MDEWPSSTRWPQDRGHGDDQIYREHHPFERHEHDVPEGDDSVGGGGRRLRFLSSGRVVPALSDVQEQPVTAAVVTRHRFQFWQH